VSALTRDQNAARSYFFRNLIVDADLDAWPDKLVLSLREARSMWREATLRALAAYPSA
jgi:hypothetical protein